VLLEQSSSQQICHSTTIFDARATQHKPVRHARTVDEPKNWGFEPPWNLLSLT
jgi:hypothetical protein